MLWRYRLDTAYLATSIYEALLSAGAKMAYTIDKSGDRGSKNY